MRVSFAFVLVVAVAVLACEDPTPFFHHLLRLSFAFRCTVVALPLSRMLLD